MPSNCHVYRRYRWWWCWWDTAREANAMHSKDIASPNARRWTYINTILTSDGVGVNLFFVVCSLFQFLACTERKIQQRNWNEDRTFDIDDNNNASKVFSVHFYCIYSLTSCAQTGLSPRKNQTIHRTIYFGINFHFMPRLWTWRIWKSMRSKYLGWTTDKNVKTRTMNEP